MILLRQYYLINLIFQRNKANFPTGIILLLSLIFIPFNCAKLIAQNVEIESIKNSTNNLQEKIYIHTDRNFYLASEIC